MPKTSEPSQVPGENVFTEREVQQSSILVSLRPVVPETFLVLRLRSSLLFWDGRCCFADLFTSSAKRLSVNYTACSPKLLLSGFSEEVVL